MNEPYNHLPPLIPEVLETPLEEQLGTTAAIRSCTDVETLQNLAIGALGQLSVNKRVLKHVLKGGQ